MDTTVFRLGGMVKDSGVVIGQGEAILAQAEVTVIFGIDTAPEPMQVKLKRMIPIVVAFLKGVVLIHPIAEAQW